MEHLAGLRLGKDVPPWQPRACEDNSSSCLIVREVDVGMWPTASQPGERDSISKFAKGAPDGAMSGRDHGELSTIWQQVLREETPDAAPAGAGRLSFRSFTHGLSVGYMTTPASRAFHWHGGYLSAAGGGAWHFYVPGLIVLSTRKSRKFE